MKIKNSKFKELDFLVFLIIGTSAISKTIILVDNIKTVGKMATYLQSRLFFRLCKKEALFIQMFLVILIIKSRSQMFEDF